MEQYNQQLYYKHPGWAIKKYKSHFYIDEYAEDSAKIIKKLLSLTKESIIGYRASIELWLQNYPIDCEEKRKTLSGMFEDFAVVMIYDAAGTGKSTLISQYQTFLLKRTKYF